ncbi:hypothetical protein TRFO_29586 [Tritrichomonas foetus]|uniref:SH3 domain-containing protein n=1 Tax=Tritrichomonas foetus TaxID=1144522 RepID=A0A1J4JZX0_9EUKA|nr:hypothetical protein TRFO_29586 [Tritrichomonas foetus]|eukprot:OHT03076.1 hypothetical protein TRFO_29586 [Tritrichomonas foetus]
MKPVQLQEEKKKYAKHFRNICLYASKVGKRHEFFSKTYFKFGRILSSTLASIPHSEEFHELSKHNGSSNIQEKNQEAPGIYGSTIENFQEMFRIIDIIVVAAKVFSKEIQNEIVDVISSLFSFECELIAKEKMNVRNAHLLRKEAMHVYLARQKNVADLYALIEKEKTITQNSPNNDHNPKLKGLLLKYFSALSSSRSALHDLNFAHQKYIRTIIQSVIQIRVAMVQRITQLKSIFFLGYPFIIRLAEQLEKFAAYQEKNKEEGSLWKTEFSQFVSANKLYRSPQPIRKFEVYNFSFVDHMIPFPFVSLACQHGGFPLHIGKITRKFSPGDFSSNNSVSDQNSPQNNDVASEKVQDSSESNVNNFAHEIEVEEGEKVFVYENPVYDWILIAKPHSHKFGFVPTKIVEIVSGETLVTTMPHVCGKEESGFCFSSAELVLKKGDSDENGCAVLCECLCGAISEVSRHELGSF